MPDDISLILQKIDLILYYVKAQEERGRINDKELYEWLSKDEVMEYLRISSSTYYEWVKKGYLIPCSKLGEDRYRVEYINKFIAENRNPNKERTDFSDRNRSAI